MYYIIIKNNNILIYLHHYILTFYHVTPCIMNIIFHIYNVLI